MTNESFVVDELIPHLASWLTAYGTVHTASGRTITNDLLKRTSATALFVRSTTKVDAALLDGTNVTVVASATAGIDHVDVELLAQRGIRFLFAPGSNAWAVAEYVVTMVADLFPRHSEVRIGIVGYGNVGRRLAMASHKLGWTVFINDPPLLDAGTLEAPSYCRVVDLDELCRSCNVVTVHTPLVDAGRYATHHLLSSLMLAHIADGSIVINAARGGIVDERALVAEHRRGRLTAVLDVFEGEPDVSPETLAVVERVTPHIAGYSIDAKEAGARAVLDGYLSAAVRDHAELRVETVRTTSLRLDPSPLHAISHELRHGGAAAFDHLRKHYPLRHEVLRHWVYS